MHTNCCCKLLLLWLCILGASEAAWGLVASPSSHGKDNQRLLSRVRRIIGNADEVDANQKTEMFPFSVTLTGSYTSMEPREIGHIKFHFPVKKQVHCGASILSKNHVITAAHCLYDSDGNLIASRKWRVYMNGVKRKPSLLERMRSWFARKTDKITGSNLSRNVAHHAHFERMYVHPHYDKENVLHDIAIIKTSDMRYDSIDHAGSINLPPPEVVSASGPSAGELCHYAGWGCTQPKGGIRDKLLMAQFTVKPLSHCTDVYRDADPVTWSNNLCVRANQTTVCPGDSGGGLRCVHNGRPYLAGVASSAATGHRPERYPANFMRISAYMSWIRRVMAL